MEILLLISDEPIAMVQQGGVSKHTNDATHDDVKIGSSMQDGLI